MKTISKFIILLICCMFFTNTADAWFWNSGGYHEESCNSSGGCSEGWNQSIIGDNVDCICWKCDEGSECEAEKGIMKGCTPLQVKLKEAKDCLFCPLFSALYDAVRTMATEAFNVTKDPIRNVILYGFAIYIAFGVLKLVSSITKQDAPKYISGLLVDTCKFLVAFLLLQNADTIYYYLINPLLSTALDFGGSMLFTSGEAISVCKTSSAGLSGSSGVILPDSLYVSLDCFIRGVQSEIAFAQAAGSSVMCVGMNEASGAFGIWDFSMVFSGLAIYLCALLLSLAFGFYLIDSVVMLGVLGALMTFFIACWPFKMSSGYTGKGFNMFMNVFFTFIFMGIVVSINTQLIKAALAAGGLENLEVLLTENNIKDTKQILDITGAGFLIVLCCCFFGFKFTAKSASLASSMAGGGGIDIGAKLGTLLTSGAVNSAKRVGQSAVMPTVNKAWQGVKDAGNKALEVTGDAIYHPMKSARKLGGVVTKRFGQAQKAVGATQGIVGNLKGDADMIKKGEKLYNKGKANQTQGQARIDIENAALHPEKQKDTNYENFNGNNSGSSENNEDITPIPTNNNGNNERIQQLEQEKAELIQELEKAIAEGNITTEQKAELERKLQDKQQELENEKQKMENEKHDMEQQIQAAQQPAIGSGGYQSTYTEAQNKYDENYQNVQPKTIEECEKLMEQAKRDYQQNIDNYKNEMNASINAVNENLKAQLEMQTAKNKMDTATNSTDYNNAHMQYIEASKKFNTTLNQSHNSAEIAKKYQSSAYASAMVYGKYQYAEEQMKKGANIDWTAAHKTGKEESANIMHNIENAVPRNG